MRSVTEATDSPITPWPWAVPCGSSSPVYDPEHGGSDYHWFQFMERGEIFSSLPSIALHVGRLRDSYLLVRLAVLPSRLSRVVWRAGVLRPGHSGADQLDQVGRPIFLYFHTCLLKSFSGHLSCRLPALQVPGSGGRSLCWKPSAVGNGEVVFRVSRDQFTAVLWHRPAEEDWRREWRDKEKHNLEEYTWFKIKYLRSCDQIHENIIITCYSVISILLGLYLRRTNAHTHTKEN